MICPVLILWAETGLKSTCKQQKTLKSSKILKCRATQSLMEKVPNYNQGETICNRIKGNKNCIVFLAILTHNCFAIVFFLSVCVYVEDLLSSQNPSWLPTILDRNACLSVTIVIKLQSFTVCILSYTLSLSIIFNIYNVISMIIKTVDNKKLCWTCKTTHKKAGVMYSNGKSFQS